jgi:predicted nucleic acid-binding protein
MLIDTDVLIWLGRGDRRAATTVAECSERHVSSISLMELIQGARSQAEVAQIRRFFLDQDFEILPLNETVSFEAVALMERHARSSGLTLADALIAATARVHALPLVTGNRRHFAPVGGLDVRVFRPASSH